MSKIFRVYNSAMPTSVGLAGVSVSTIKTMLQVAPSANQELDVVGWGYSLGGLAAAQPGTVELIETNTAATVTAYVAQDITLRNTPNDAASIIQLGTALSGYTASAEGSPTAIRLGDSDLFDPALTPWFKQVELGRAFRVRTGKFLRVRATFGTAVNMVCWVDYAEAGD